MSDDVSSRLRVIVPAASEPVSLGEAKLFLRIEHGAEDAVIARAIAAAREACELYVGSALLPQTFSLTVPCDGKVRVALPFGPATAVETVTVAADGGQTELEATEYRLGIDGRALFFDWPPEGDALTVAYTAAMAEDADKVPALLKQGLLHHVAALMEQREGFAPVPIASLQCYQPFRQVRL